ncbi:MAG: hypothetical protein JO027_03540 [Solirubrobacterales bacterium]|nr:hypothetical protein [Streptosporangiaceae bacterium]MBV9604152.1 hypothetical protein [Solirubrobacterales bacterium]MBV9853339.1 hypothetical protein [Streptosporangiaceae bacterium]
MTAAPCTQPGCGGTIEDGYRTGSRGTRGSRSSRSYRALARLTPDARRRVELVDMANAVRPRTWV